MDEDEPITADRATELFHHALSTFAGREVAHDFEGDFVDGPASSVVEALLEAGWRPGRP